MGRLRNNLVKTFMFVDSHCHIDFPDFADRIDQIISNMAASQVKNALCISVNTRDFPRVTALADRYPHIYATAGVHPDHEVEQGSSNDQEVSVDDLIAMARHPKVVAIGETGLDYYRLTGDLEWQRNRFRTHIRAAKALGLPLIVHTRSSAADTVKLLHEEDAQSVGGVMHCFTETLEIAQQAIALGFYISISGIVTFKNATQVKEVAREIPLDRLLIETDSPYLAPVPFRGKTNEPAYVKHVAEEIATLRGLTVQQVAQATTDNFHRLFERVPRREHWT
jgi:TatD DNase family protein